MIVLFLCSPQAVQAVKPGGVLVYSTCTFTTAENEHIVAWALKTFPSLSLVKQVLLIILICQFFYQ